MNEDRRLDKQLEEEFAEDVLDLRAKLSAITKGEMPAAQKEKKSGKLIRLFIPGLAIAASILLAVLFLPSLWDQATPNELYASYYETYPMALNQRGDAEPDLNQAISSYIAQDYALSSQKFQALYQNNQETVHLLYAANSELALGNDDKAIQLYDAVISDGNIQVVEQAQWYKALALIKLGKIDSARNLLLSLGSDHYKSNEVKELLRKL